MKRLTILTALLFLLFISDCKTYVTVDEPADVLFSKNKVSDHLGGYDVYLHKKNGVYRLENAYVSNDTLYGQPVAIDSSALNGDAHDHRFDMHVYSKQESDSTLSGYVAVPKKNIAKVGMTGVDLRKTFVDEGKNDGDGDKDGDGLILGMSVLVFVLLMVVLAILLFWLIIYLIGQASNQAANASSSGSNSGTSNSGSGGSSSGGNGGGSGSGGSNSGCYIATMVYGDYDAPEVMVLRKFRDETLSRFKAGRAFIQWYYSWSPGFVERYHHLRWLHRSIRFVLDGLVRLLSRW